MYKTMNGRKKQYWVDTIWTTDGLFTERDILTKFGQNYTHSDHC